MSVAIANVQRHGIKISKPNINTSQLGFTPDTENHSIRFGLRAIAGLSDDMANKIIENRPYSSFQDFMNKVQPTNSQALTIIKSGAFDEFDKVSEILKRYEEYKIKQRKNITLTQTPLLKQLKLIPSEYKQYISLYDFNKYCKKELKKDDTYYYLNSRALRYIENNYSELLENNKINIKEWDKQYKHDIKPLQQFYKNNKEELIDKVRLGEMKKQYIEDGGLRLEESHNMSTLNCYIENHELSTVNKNFYNIKYWDEMPEEPEQIGNSKYAKYKIYSVIGTVIRKEKTHSSITLLDPSGNTFNVQFSKSVFARYEKEKTFERGNLLMIQGYRRGSRFSPKVYKDNIYEIVEKINSTDKKGHLIFN